MTGATEHHTYNAVIGDVVKNYSTAYAENITDTVFLLDIQQIYNVYSNDTALGGGYYNAILSDLLRSPDASSSYNAHDVDDDGDVDQACAYNPNSVRPAFYLNQSSVIFASGNGTSENPYELLNIPDQTYTGTTIEPDNFTVTNNGTEFVKDKDYEDHVLGNLILERYKKM